MEIFNSIREALILIEGLATPLQRDPTTFGARLPAARRSLCQLPQCGRLRNPGQLRQPHPR